MRQGQRKISLGMIATLVVSAFLFAVGMITQDVKKEIFGIIPKEGGVHNPLIVIKMRINQPFQKRYQILVTFRY